MPLNLPALLVGLLLFAGCGGGESLLRSVDDPCAILPGQAAEGGLLHFALADSVDPAHLAFPVNDAENLLFRQLYETLLSVNCDGSLRPELAESWRREPAAEGGGWIFTIREGACFWDGQEVEASDVLASWMATSRVARGLNGHLPCPAIEPLTTCIQIVDSRRIRVTPRVEPAGFPRQLALPAFAISSARPLLYWNLGTGPLRPRGLHLRPQGEIICYPNHRHPAPANWSEIIFPILSGIDPRNFTYEGADAFQLRDRRILPLFRGLEDMTAVNLSWDRLYILVLPRGGAFADALGGDPDWYERLAGEVNGGVILHAQAIAATTSWLWEFLPNLVFMTDPTVADSSVIMPGEYVAPPLPVNPLIRYPVGDPDARELAARIAALASRSDGYGRALAISPIVSPDTGADFEIALERALTLVDNPTDEIFILPVRRGAVYPLELGCARLLPLALSRSSLVVNRDLVGVAVGLDGIPLLNHAGWRLTPETAP
ncbi:MAG: hypothetical protein GY835_11215 [bacterium]|nr:hypothetical protein [bacterium]